MTSDRHEPDPEELVARMRAGDREAAAEFVTRYGPRIRRRIRGKLSPSMRRLFDSQDILSTVGRRLDMYVRSGRLEASGEAQLWALVMKMALNAVVDKARVYKRLQSVEGEDAPFAHDLLLRLQRVESIDEREPELELEHAFSMLSDEVDRQVLTLWLMGMEHSRIAELLELSSDVVRKRWQRIRETLRERLIDRVEL